MGIYVFFLLLLAPVTDEATCNALLPLYGEHISYSQARDGAQWTDEQVASFFSEAPKNEDPSRFVGALASWLSPRTRYQTFAACWQQWGNSLDQPGHRAIAELIYTQELSSLQRQGFSDSVITRYFEIQDIWQFSGVSGIEVQYAIALHDSGDYENAIDELERFLSQSSFTAEHPEYSNVLNAIGNVYYDLDRYDEAEYFYGEAKGKLYGFLNMVEWHFRMDQFEDAKLWIDSVFTIMPEVASHFESVQAYKQLARFFDLVWDPPSRISFRWC